MTRSFEVERERGVESQVVSISDEKPRKDKIAGREENLEPRAS